MLSIAVTVMFVEGLLKVCGKVSPIDKLKSYNKVSTFNGSFQIYILLSVSFKKAIGLINHQKFQKCYKGD